MANGTLKVQNIETSSGSGTITLGQSGETISVGTTLEMASGKTQNNLLYPAFHVRRSGSQSISNTTWTKVELNAEDYNTNDAFDITTNYEFKPTIAGLYYFYWNFRFASGTDFNSCGSRIYKNSDYIAEGNIRNEHYENQQVTGITRLNGTTDTVSFYARQDSGGAINIDGTGGGNARVTYAGGFRIGD